MQVSARGIVRLGAMFAVGALVVGVYRGLTSEDVSFLEAMWFGLKNMAFYLVVPVVVALVIWEATTPDEPPRDREIS